MNFKKFLTLLTATLFLVPFLVIADDFSDDFEDDFGDSSEEAEESSGGDDFFDAEESAAKAKEKRQSESEAAMKDLLGDSDDESESGKEAPASEEEKTETEKGEEPENHEAFVEEEARHESGAQSQSSAEKSGFRPVILIKGGFTLLGNYTQKVEDVKKDFSSLFGSADEALLGVEYLGKYVIAKGTMNLRTANPFINKGDNELAKNNLRSIQNGFNNALYEIYGGVKFFGLFIKGGKMIPEYGLIDSYQNLGMGFSTPFLTRSLIAVEGFIPETDAGFSIGYNDTFNNNNIFAGLSLGTGAINSSVWDSDKTMGLYARIGYGFKDYIKAAFAFQYRKDYYLGNIETKGKNIDVIGIGFHLNVAAYGFEMPIAFDYTMFKNIRDDGLKKGAANILLSVAPGYAYHFNHNWIDKVSIALRFDYIRGVYVSDSYYLDLKNYRNASYYMRIGVTSNFFTKDFMGVRGMAGLTFLIQPESTVIKKKAGETTGGKINYGFTTLMLTAGAEF